MLSNFIKVAIRNLLKHRIYSIINALGLSVSLASCLFIALYVQHELSYDRFIDRSDRIYKLALERKYPSHSIFYASVAHSFAGVMKHDFPEIERTLLMGGPFPGSLISYKKNDSEVISFEEKYIMAGDSTFFSFFNFPLLKGNPQKALALAGSVVISESAAKRYFGNEDPIGKTLSGDFNDLKVTGICKDLPDNTHMKFDLLISAESFGYLKRENFIRFYGHIYLELKPGADAAALANKFPKMVETYAAPQIEQQYGQSWEDYVKAGNGYRYFLQPLTSIHLDPTNIEDPLTPSGNLQYIYILVAVALVILTIACVNFMNLATARSAERALEVGIRKAIGSEKRQLILQFLSESILLASFSTLLAVVIVALLLPPFNAMVQKNLTLSMDVRLLSGLLALPLTIGLLAGLYPAFVLSGYKPADVLKGSYIGLSGRSLLRSGLVVFQFTISIALIVATTVIIKQLSFMQSKDLGFKKDQVLIIERGFALGKNSEAFMEEIRRMKGVEGVGGSSHIMGTRGSYFGDQYQPEGSSEIITVKGMSMDDDFAQVIGFELAEGRFFSRQTNDSLTLILNEAAVKSFGIKNPVGFRLTKNDQGPNGTVIQRTFTIVGVLKDFHFQPLRDEITPVIFRSGDFFQFNRAIAVRFRGNPKDIVPVIGQKWKELLPDQPLKYSFLDEHIAREYESEDRSGELFGLFSAVAIIIACVGLFGLCAYTTSLRRKEIGIRKIMGASVSGIVFLLSGNFSRLVVISFTLSVPIAWWMMNKWLAGFAYRIELGADSFILAGITAFGIAWITVSYQSIKAAMENPVKSLRNE